MEVIYKRRELTEERYHFILRKIIERNFMKRGKIMLDILFVTDFVCPYCIVAEEALNQAMDEMGLLTQVRFWPMELTEEPKERVDTYNDPVRREHYKVLDEPVRKLGLDVKLPPAVIPRPYTRLAWEGWHYAKEKGLGDVYASRMYRAYFTDELDIGELDILVKIAGELGLDTEEFRNALLNGTYKEAEKEDNAYSKKVLQVRHVPTIYMDGQEVEIKEYTKEEMIRILTRVLETPSGSVSGEKQEVGELEEMIELDPWQETNTDENPSEKAAAGGFGGCGPDGCSF